MTVMASGSSLGGVVRTLMLNNTLDRIGFGNAVRANAGLVTCCLIAACFLMRTRLPPPKKLPNFGKAVRKFSRDGPYILATLGYGTFILPSVMALNPAPMHQNVRVYIWFILIV